MTAGLVREATHERSVSLAGTDRALRSMEAAVAAISSYALEMHGSRPTEKARAVFHTVFAALARRFSLGSMEDTIHPGDLSGLKSELAEMTLAYLRYAD